MEKDDLLKYMDDQKKQENELVNQRTNWGLATNSFLVISTAIAASKGNETILFQLIVPIVGFNISAAAFMGVCAAKKQLEYLKSHWKRIHGWSDLDIHGKEQIVRPFGDRRVSKMGAWPTLLIFLTFMAGWLAVLMQFAFLCFFGMMCGDFEVCEVKEQQQTSLLTAQNESTRAENADLNNLIADIRRQTAEVEALALALVSETAEADVTEDPVANNTAAAVTASTAAALSAEVPLKKSER